MAETQRISAEEAENLREILLRYERDKGPNVFDLSKPPVEPYTYKAFPQVLYDHANSHRDSVAQTRDLLGNVKSDYVPAKYATRTVNSTEELEAALAEGWQAKPPVFSDEPEETAPVELVAQPRRPGRPRKEV